MNELGIEPSLRNFSNEFYDDTMSGINDNLKKGNSTNKSHKAHVSVIRKFRHDVENGHVIDILSHSNIVRRFKQI